MNTAYFDCLSFWKEPVTCYKYDADGNVVAVTAEGMEDMGFKYSAGDLIQTSDKENGVYDYTYDDKHNLTKVKNDGVEMDLTYDDLGHVKATILKNTEATEGRTISTTAEYTEDGNYLKSQRDALGNETVYETNARGLVSKVTDALGNKLQYEYNEENDRLDRVYLTEGGEVGYTYADGVLASILREGQEYSFAYDTYDNVTAIKAGTRTLVTYEYMEQNGPLKKMTYGNGFTREYECDALYRVVAEKENGVLKYRYSYGAGKKNRKGRNWSMVMII